MDFLLHFLLLFGSLNSFLKFLIFISFLLVFLIFFYEINFIKKYESEMLNFDLLVKNKNFNFKDFYEIIINRNYNNIGLSAIFLSGFQEIVKLNRKGITDVNLIIKIIEKIMLNIISKEIYNLFLKLKFILFFGNFLLCICFILTFVKFLFFLTNIHICSFSQFSSPVFIFALSEFFILFFCALLIAFIIKIIYYKYSLVVYKISNRYFLFYNEFIIIFVNKLFD